MDSLFAVLDWPGEFIKLFRAALSTTLLKFKIHIKLVADLCGSAAAFPN